MIGEDESRRELEIVAVLFLVWEGFAFRIIISTSLKYSFP